MEEDKIPTFLLRSEEPRAAFKTWSQRIRNGNTESVLRHSTFAEPSLHNQTFGRSHHLVQFSVISIPEQNALQDARYCVCMSMLACVTVRACMHAWTRAFHRPGHNRGSKDEQ